MGVNGISGSVSALHAVQRPEHVAQPNGSNSSGSAVSGAGFAERLGQAVESVNAQQLKAAKAVEDFEMGKTNDLVGVMVEQQISSLGFEMTKQVRNKALTAYRDIMNMPV